MSHSSNFIVASPSDDYNTTYNNNNKKLLPLADLIMQEILQSSVLPHIMSQDKRISSIEVQF